ncbi:MAG: OmpA family protein [Bacteroidales bacterium]|jgi:chemotaxis protein MotB|nr:OmpA family protein [Bacteroidales bacterium]
MRTKILLISVLLLAILASCVPARQYQDEKERRQNAESEAAKMRAELDQTKTSNLELEEKIKLLKKQVEVLEKDTTMTGISLRKMNSQYDKLNVLYEQLNKKYDDLLRLNASETQKISSELQLTQDQLSRKEAELKALENELNLRRQNLDKMQADIALKEKKISELEGIIAKKESIMKALRDNLSVALKGFENNGLSIIEKDGKIYVSMDETLLFASGSWSVNAKGKQALNNLSDVLASNPDIFVMVEGHTDNVPYRGSGQVKDNWDLSVMRATSVVKIILSNSSVNPNRITAAGRGEYVPIESGNNSEARQKNRRTEIILTPNMDEFMKILNNQ